MTDDEHKREVQEAAALLNAAIRNASGAGLTVEVRMHRLRVLGIPECEVVETSLARITKI